MDQRLMDAIEAATAQGYISGAERRWLRDQFSIPDEGWSDRRLIDRNARKWPA